MPYDAARLFRTVVVYGAALTGGCANPAPPETTIRPDGAHANATAPEASAPDASAPDASTPDASTPETSAPETSAPDASAPSARDASIPDANAPDAKRPCPPGSEMPYPPCYFIR